MNNLLKFIIFLPIILGVSLLFPKSASAAITSAQTPVSNTTNNGTTVAASFGSAPTANNLIVVVCSSRAAGSTLSISSPSGFTGLTQQDGSVINQAVFYKISAGSGDQTITCDKGTGNSRMIIQIYEYSGVDTSAPFDAEGSTSGTGTSAGSGSVTTVAANTVILAAISTDDTTNNAASFASWTNSFGEQLDTNAGASTSRLAAAGADLIVASQSTYSTAATISNIGASDEWLGKIVSFKEAPFPTKVVFTNASRTLTAGTCNGAGSVFTMQLQDAADVPTNPTGTTVIRITSNSSDYTIYSDSSCASPVTNGDFTFTTSEHTKDVYIIDNKKSISTRTLTATKQSGPDTITTGTQNYTVNAGSVTRLVVTLPGQSFTDGVGNSGSATDRTAGSSFNITSISATDNFFNVNTSYSGGKTLAYVGPGNAPDTTAPTYTTSVSFTSGQSTTTLATTLFRAESTTITVTEGGSFGFASSSVTVVAGALNDFVVSVATPQTAGVCFTGTNTVTARDTWQNTRTQETSVINMTSTGTGVTFYTTGGCGTPTTQYTLSSGTTNIFIRTNKKQSFTVTATKDGSTETGTSSSVTVNPAAASAILVVLPNQSFVDGTGVTGSTSFTGLRSPNSTAGTSFTVDLKAVDAFNNLVDSGPSNYTGSKTFSYADSVAGNSPSGQTPSFPSTNPTFSNGEADGLTATYYNATTGRTFEADDTGTPVSGTASTSFTVQAAAVDAYIVAPAAAPQTAGVAFNVTVTAVDEWENALGSLYSAPAGTYIWTTNATNAPDTTAPSIGTLAQGNFTNGVAVKSVTLYKAESGVTFTASEPSPSTVTGTSTTTVTVSAGDISADSTDSTVTGDSETMQGIPITITVLLRDTWRNPKVGVSNSNITLASTGGGESITQPSSPTDSSGITTGSIEWSTTGAKVVDVTISTVTLVQNDGVTPDADGKLDSTLGVTVNVFVPQGVRVVGDLNVKGDTRIQ